jgi:hypothetical protein
MDTLTGRGRLGMVLASMMGSFATALGGVLLPIQAIVFGVAHTRDLAGAADGSAFAALPLAGLAMAGAGVLLAGLVHGRIPLSCRIGLLLNAAVLLLVALP